MKQIHATDQAPAAIGPYSQAVELNGLIFCSGQIPLTPGGDLITGSIEDQTKQVMANIANLLSSMGLGYQHIVKATIFLSSMDHFASVNEIYGQHFPTDPPARSTVAVAGLPKGVDIEIEVIAFRPNP